MTDYTEITVVGDDDTGLIARVTTILFERGINIEDLDQAVRDGLFRMTMHVDASEMTCSREELRSVLTDLGRDLELDVQVRFPADREARQIAVLVTRESHCLEAVLTADADGEFDADVGVVIGNHDDLRERARAYDVPFHDVGDDSGAIDENELLSLFERFDVDLIVLSRFMRILSPNVVFRYEDRIINVHPSLLPSFPGAQAYRQAIEAGVRIAGVTAHYVTTDLDQGPIITQRAFNVPDDATLTEVKRRGQPLEAEALIEAIRLHLDDAIAVHRGRTELRGRGEYQLGMDAAVDAHNPEEPVDESIAAEVLDPASDD